MPPANSTANATLVGFAVPLLICVAWLRAEGALQGFELSMQVLVPFHASLDRQSFGKLLYGALTPLAPLFAAWLLCLSMRQKQTTQPGPAFAAIAAERHLAFACLLLSLLGYFLQAKGFPYQRYPFMVFGLALLTSDLTAILQEKAIRGKIALAAFAWSFLIFAPLSLLKALRYQGAQTEFRRNLQSDLTAISHGRPASLSGEVQCIDSIAGCTAALYNLRIVQSTPLLYDEFLFNSPDAKAVTVERAAFLKDAEAAPPYVLVISSDLFPSGPGGYAKLLAWPDFNNWLAHTYRLIGERDPKAVRSIGRSFVPPGYRIYLRR